MGVMLIYVMQPRYAEADAFDVDPYSVCVCPASPTTCLHDFGYVQHTDLGKQCFGPQFAFSEDVHLEMRGWAGLPRAALADRAWRSSVGPGRAPRNQSTELRRCSNLPLEA